MAIALLDLYRELRAALIADPVLASEISDRVFINPPADPEFPYVSYNLSSSNPDEAPDGCDRLEEVFLDYHVWTREADRSGTQCAKIGMQIQRVFDALTNALPDLGSAARLESLHRIGYRQFNDKDNVTWHGVVSVRALTSEV